MSKCHNMHLDYIVYPTHLALPRAVAKNAF
jgi:hypothetical protein